MRYSRISLFIFASLVSFQAVGCKDTCENADTACGTVPSCCNPAGTKCYYKYDGKKYYCDGTDCTDAAQTVAELMCNTTSSGTGLIGTVEKQALEQTRKLLTSDALFLEYDGGADTDTE